MTGRTPSPRRVLVFNIARLNSQSAKCRKFLHFLTITHPESNTVSFIIFNSAIRKPLPGRKARAFKNIKRRLFASVIYHRSNIGSYKMRLGHLSLCFTFNSRAYRFQHSTSNFCIVSMAYKYPVDRQPYEILFHAVLGPTKAEGNTSFFKRFF